LLRMTRSRERASATCRRWRAESLRIVNKTRAQREFPATADRVRMWMGSFASLRMTARETREGLVDRLRRSVRSTRGLKPR
jgi:hypothetical protein